MLFGLAMVTYVPSWVFEDQNCFGVPACDGYTSMTRTLSLGYIANDKSKGYKPYKLMLYIQASQKEIVDYFHVDIFI